MKFTLVKETLEKLNMDEYKVVEASELTLCLPSAFNIFEFFVSFFGADHSMI
jgi:hypothetical protein